jgi:hypothetical protein
MLVRVLYARPSSFPCSVQDVCDSLAMDFTAEADQVISSLILRQDQQTVLSGPRGSTDYQNRPVSLLNLESHSDDPLPITRHTMSTSQKPKRKNVVMASHGRAPWYGPDGKTIEAYVIGIAGGSASGKVSLCL